MTHAALLPSPALFDVTDATAEVLLFRLSLAGPVSARSLRRPIDDVLVVR